MRFQLKKCRVCPWGLPRSPLESWFGMKRGFIAGKCCRIYSYGEADLVLIQPTGPHENDFIDEEYNLLKSSSDEYFALVALEVDDWNEELSPWDAKPVFGQEKFGSGAGKTLEYTTNELIPALGQIIKMPQNVKFILGGYSLAGLFSLWSAYKTNAFSAVAACSPSVWFDGWMDFVKKKRPLVQNIYLSLGSQEHRTCNPRLVSVRENITIQLALLSALGINTHMDFNPGSHFQDNPQRVVKGFLWCMENCKKKGIF